MLTQFLKAKIHRAKVTQVELDYVGSITIDVALLEAAGIREYEKVQVVDIDNGQRLETYAICGERNSGIICLNGAAARLVNVRDKVIIMTYALLQESEIETFAPKVVFVDDNNKVTRVVNHEKHGLYSEHSNSNPESL